MACGRSVVGRVDRGSVLVVVLLAILVLLGLGMLGLYYTTSTVRMAANIGMVNEARVVAEGGLERARSVLLDGTLPVPLPALLAGSGNAADEVPSSTSFCQGERRGAVLVDFHATPSIPLVKISYPSTSRSSDMPGSAGSVSPSLGTYTVYVRQDLGECRMGNFTCDTTGPDAGSSPYGATNCVPSGGLPTTNGYVVVRSEGTAIDGRTVDVVEKTFLLRKPATPPTGGSGGSTSTGGSSGTGGVGGAGGTGGVGGTGGYGGVGGFGGSGGSTSPGPCLNYAVTAVAPCSNGGTPGCITINGGSKVDSYDPGLGSYGPGNHGPASVSMTCSKVASSCPDNCLVGCITGTVDYGNASSFNPGTMPVPPHTTNPIQLSVPPNHTVTPSGATVIYYDEVDLNSGGTLTLKAGRYVVNRLNLNSNSTLYIDDDGGPVTLWVLSAFSPNSTVTVKSGNPDNFWLVYDGTQQLNNNTNNSFMGVIFAPAAEVNLNYAVTGAVVGGKVTLNSNAKVHFDANLRCPG